MFCRLQGGLRLHRVSRVERYDAATGTFCSIDDLHQARWYHTVPCVWRPTNF
ncbi:MAG TPA: hypothetical protein VGB26_00735 [Nitrospiria bacterium]